MKGLIFLVLAGVLVGLCALTPTVAIDYWLNHATGKLIWHFGIPKSDPFAFTTGGALWLEHKWLWDVVLYKLSHLGVGGPIVAKCLVVGGIFLVGATLMPNLWQRSLWLLGVLLLMQAQPDRISERAHLPADLLMLASLAWHLRKHDHPELKIWPLLLLQLLWVNLHGSFILGPLLAICFIPMHAGKRLQKQLLLVALLGATCLVNPYGAKLILSPLAHAQLSLQGGENLAEWQPLDWRNAHLALQLLAGFIAAAFCWVLYQSRHKLTVRAPWGTFLLVAGFTLLAVRSYRFVLTSLLALLLISLWQLGRVAWPKLEPALARRARLLVQLLTGLTMVAASMIAALQLQRNFSQSPFRLLAPQMPEAAVDFMVERQLNGNIFNSFDHGMYVAARLGPQSKIFLDGRLDLYPGTVFADYYRLMGDENAWQLSPWRAHIDMILLNYSTVLASGFLQRRLADKNWEMVYMDDHAALLLRNDLKQFKPTIEQYRYRYLLPTGELKYLQPLAARAPSFRATLDEVLRARQSNRRFKLSYVLEGQLKEFHPSRVIRARACEAYEHASLLWPDDGQIKMILASCLGEQGALGRAINLFRELCELPTWRSRALLNLGLAYAKMGLMPEAKASWETLRDEEPGHPTVANYLNLIAPLQK